MRPIRVATNLRILPLANPKKVFLFTQGFFKDSCAASSIGNKSEEALKGFLLGAWRLAPAWHRLFAFCAVTPGCTHEKSSDNNLAIMLLLGAMGSRSSSSSRVFPQALERWQCKTTGTSGDYRVIPIDLAASDNTQQEIEEY
jgi:hypothetical protein